MDKILSLIVPSYNMEAYLPRCIGSLGLSDMAKRDRLDIIIVNDGSHDRTSTIAHEYEAKYPGVVRVVDKPNGHYGSCINAALQVADGTFVKILEPDDGYDTQSFRAFVDELVNGESAGRLADVDLVVTDYDFTDTAGNPTKVVRFDYPVRQRLTFGEFQKPLAFHIQLPAVTYRTAVLRQMGYRQTEGCPYTDLEWLTYPMHLVRSAYYLPYSIYRYFIGRDGQSMNPETFKKGIGTIVRLMRRMLGDYAMLVDSSRPAVAQYVEKVILAQLHIVYESYLIQRNPYLAKEDVIALDEAVCTVPTLYKKSGDFALHSRRFDFRYVNEFRRTRSRNSLKFAALRLYAALASVKG